jgi:hypothetical protein
MDAERRIASQQRHDIRLNALFIAGMVQRAGSPMEAMREIERMVMELADACLFEHPKGAHRWKWVERVTVEGLNERFRERYPL